MFTLSDSDLARVLIRLDYARDYMARDHAARTFIDEAEEILLESADWAEDEADQRKVVVRDADNSRP